MIIAIFALICIIPISGESIFDTQNSLLEDSSSIKINKNIKSINSEEVLEAGATSKKKLSKVGKLSGKAGLSKLQKYVNKNFNHANGGSSTAKGVKKSRRGDCWGLAEWSGNELKKNGYKVRIVQGRTRYASNHRWVQAKVDKKWVNFESSLVTKRYGSKHYSTTCTNVNKIVRYV